MSSSSSSQNKIGGEYGEVRASIDIDSLNEYLGKHVKRVRAPVKVKQFKFGQSNPTYFLTDASDTKFVLRKKPAGQLLSSTAHQVEREYRVLHAIHTHNTRASSPSEKVPVPEPIALCEDTNVLGTPFYIMEFLDGRIFTDSRMLEIPKEERRLCWLSSARALASLSKLDPKAIGLENFGPPSSYFPRQIKSLSRVSQAQASAVDVDSNEPVGPIPSFEPMLSFYSSRLPDEHSSSSSIGSARIVHGDYKIDNLIFHPKEPRVIGILDWELTTLGHPLADFGNLTMPWAVDAKDISGFAFGDMRAFRGAGEDEEVPVELDELEREYSKAMGMGYPIRDMIVVRSWMLFRLAVIAQGIAARYARRQASSERAHLYAQMFPFIGELARKLLEDEGLWKADAKL